MIAENLNEAPHRDKDVLEQLYYGEGLNQDEIAERLGVATITIRRQMSRHGINPGNAEPDRDYYRDASWLSEKYVEEGLTQEEIGEICGVCTSTISKWLRRHGIEGRNKKWKLTAPVPVRTHPHKGYVRWSDRHGGERDLVKVHRLLAVSKYGFDAVCGMDVHHKDNIPWDNRPDNLEILTPEDHRSLHANQRANGGDSS